MADLFNQQISATYSGLLKTTSSGVLSASLAQITDGRGNVSQLYLSTTSVQFYGLYTFPNSNGSDGQVLKTDGAGVLTWEDDANSGTVTSVALSVPTGLTVTGSPITTSGTITIGGTLGVANGGTGATTLTGILVGNGTSAISAVTDGTVSGQVLSTNGSGTYSFIDAATGDVSISGTPVANQVAIWTNATTITGETGLIYTAGRLELNKIEVKGVSPKLSINASTSGDPILDFQDSGNTKAELFYDTVFDEEKFVIRAYAVDTVFERATDTPTLTIDGSNGSIKFNSYGSASPHTGTLAKTLGVDASGNVIEFTAATGDVTKTGTIALNTIAVWNDNADQLRSDTTMSINTNHYISLLQKNSLDTDVSSYNVGGGNIANVTGQNNTGFGQSNMQRVTTGSNNVAFGNSTLDKLTTGSNNTTVGKTSLFSLTEGDGNTSVGHSSLDEVTTGDNNTAIGKDSGNEITTGSKNVIIGSNTGSTIATSDNNIIISDGDGNNRIQVDSGGNVGIGITDPSAKLEVKENLYVSHPNAEELTFKVDNYGTTGTDAGSLLRLLNQAGTTVVNIDSRSGSNRDTYFNQGGNVGIGTDSPQGKLNVTTGLGTTGLELQRWHYSITPDRWNLRLTQVVSGNDIAWDFKQTNNNTDYGSVLTLKNGKVGIGTDSPSTKLHVQNPQKIDDAYGLLLVETTSSSSTNSGVNVKNYYGTSQFMQWESNGVRIGSRILNNGGSGDVYFTAGADSVKMLITSGGNVGIGTTSPDTTGFGWNVLTIQGGLSAGEAGVLELKTGAANSVNENLGVIAFLNGSTRVAQIDSTSEGSNNTSAINFYTHNNTSMEKRLTITSGGDATFNSQTIDVKAVSAGNTSLRLTANGGTAGTDSLDIINDGSTAYLYNRANTPLILGTNNTARLTISSVGMLEKNGNSSTARIIPATDNVGYLGDSTHRWQAVFAVNGSIQTSDRNEKTLITTSDLGLDFILKLEPVSYKWKVGGWDIEENGKDEEPTKTPIDGKRNHYGLIAQQVKEVIGDKDFGGWVKEDLEDDASMESLRYAEFISPMIKAIQEQQTIIEDLKSRIETLEG